MSSSENSFDEILDDFVVPDDTIEYEDATAELPSSPLSGADMRRGRRASEQNQRDLDVADGLMSRLCRRAFEKVNKINESSLLA